MELGSWGEAPLQEQPKSTETMHGLGGGALAGLIVVGSFVPPPSSSPELLTNISLVRSTEASAGRLEHIIDPGALSVHTEAKPPLGATEKNVKQTPRRVPNFENGRAKKSDLMALQSSEHIEAKGTLFLRADAASALEKMARAYHKDTGRALTINDAYRSFEEQVRMKILKGRYAATPGTSTHGLGTAIDVAVGGFQSDIYEWLHSNGGLYGWTNPLPLRDGIGVDEAWHFEYSPVRTSQTEQRPLPHKTTRSFTITGGLAIEGSQKSNTDTVTIEPDDLATGPEYETAEPTPPSATLETRPQTPEAVHELLATDRNTIITALEAFESKSRERGDWKYWKNQVIAVRFYVTNEHTRLNLAQACAIVGNFMVEAPGVNPKTKQWGGGPGRGIAQWSKGDRWDQLVRFADKKNIEIYDLETQLRFTVHEMRTTERRTLPALQRYKDYKDLPNLVRAFEQAYERAGKPNYGARTKAAQHLYEAVAASSKATEQPKNPVPETSEDEQQSNTPPFINPDHLQAPEQEPQPTPETPVTIPEPTSANETNNISVQESQVNITTITPQPTSTSTGETPAAESAVSKTREVLSRINW